MAADSPPRPPTGVLREHRYQEVGYLCLLGLKTPVTLDFGNWKLVQGSS